MGSTADDLNAALKTNPTDTTLTGADAATPAPPPPASTSADLNAALAGKGTTTTPADTTGPQPYEGGNPVIPEHSLGPGLPTIPAHYASNAQDLIDTTANALTLGTGKYVGAAGQAIIDKLAGSDKGFGDLFSENLDTSRGHIARFHKENPAAGIGLDVGAPIAETFIGGPLLNAAKEAGTALGSASTALEEATPASEASRVIAKMGKTAGTGAVVGGVSGAANSEGDWKNYLMGGALGTVAGAAFGTVGALASEVGSGIGNIASGLMKTDPVGWAKNFVIKALHDDGYTPAQAQTKYAAWQAAGAKPEMLLDLAGDATRRAARTVYTAGHEGASNMSEALGSRADDRSARLMGDTSDTMGLPERNIVHEAQALPGEARAATQAAQADARRSFTDVSGTAPYSGRTIAQVAGNTIRTQLQEQHDALHAARAAPASSNYGAVRASSTAVDVDPVIAAIAERKNLYGNTPTGGVMNTALGWLKSDNGTVQTQLPQLRATLSSMRSQQRAMAQSGDREPAFQLGQVADVLENQINAVDSSLQHANAQYRRASLPLAPYTDPKVGNAASLLVRDKFNTDYTTDPEQVVRRYFNSGPTAASDMQEFQTLLGRNPAALRAMRANIANEALTASTDGQGNFSLARYHQWLTQHTDALRNFPDVHNDLDTWARSVANAEGSATASVPARSLAAINAGRDILEKDPEVIRNELSGLSPQEQELYRQGSMRALREKIGGGTGPSQLLAAFSGKGRNANLQNQLAAVWPDAASFQQFAARAAREGSMAANEKFITQGTQTANKAADLGASKEPVGGEALQMIMDVASTRRISPLWNFVAGSIAKMARAGMGFTPARMKEVGAILTEKDPAKMQEMLRDLQLRMSTNPPRPTVDKGQALSYGLSAAAPGAISRYATHDQGDVQIPPYRRGGRLRFSDGGADEGGPGSDAGEGGASSDAAAGDGHGSNYGGRGGDGGFSGGSSGSVGDLPGGASGAYNSKSQLAIKDPITAAAMHNQGMEPTHGWGTGYGPGFGAWLEHNLLGLGYMDPTKMNQRALAAGKAPPSVPDTGIDVVGDVLGLAGGFAFPGGGTVMSGGYGLLKDAGVIPGEFGMVDLGNWGPGGLSDTFGGTGLGAFGAGAPHTPGPGGSSSDHGGRRLHMAGGGLAGQTLVGPDDTPPDTVGIPPQYRDAVDQSRANDFWDKAADPLAGFKDTMREQADTDQAMKRVFFAKRAGKPVDPADEQAAMSGPVMGFALGLSGPIGEGLGAGAAAGEAPRPVIGEPHGQGPEAPAVAPPTLPAPEAGGVPGRGGVSGSSVGVGPSDRQGVSAAPQGTEPLQGLPARVRVTNDRPLPDWMGGEREWAAGPNPVARQVAANYMAKTGLDPQPATSYLRVDPERGARIAQAYAEMQHNPSDPLVRASYDAMAKETLAQWKAIKKTGLRTDFIPPDGPDPYHASPRLAAEDVKRNNHLWVFPTDSGYGTEGFTPAQVAENPLLAMTKEKVGGQPARVNDIFRIVHDYFGHIKEGVGFRADGEENAWNSHARMYSPLARLAMTSETRGQNSWVNWGPHGELNRGASSPDTTYADQKIGVMPDWVMNEGAEGVTPINTGDLRKTMAGPSNPPSVRGQSKMSQAELNAKRSDINATRVGLPKAEPLSDALESAKAAVANNPNTGLFDLSREALEQTPNVPQRDLPRYNPQHGVSERMRDLMNRSDVREKMLQGIGAGVEQGSAGWYNTDQLKQAFQRELGDTHGAAAHGRFMDYVSAASPRSNVLDNIRNASFQHFLEAKGIHPNDINPNPYPYGHLAQDLHRGNAAKIRGAGYNLFENPKPPSFAENLRGNWRPGTMDAHAMKAVAMHSEDPRFLANQLRIPLKGTDLQGKQQFENIYPKRMFERGEFDMPTALKTPGYWSGRPNDNEYQALEHYYRGLGREYELDTAPTQAAAWTGHGKLTGLGTEPVPFMDLFDRVLNRTAYARGEEPRETLRRFIRGEAPLYERGGTVEDKGGSSDDDENPAIRDREQQDWWMQFRKQKGYQMPTAPDKSDDLSGFAAGGAIESAFHEVYTNTPKVVKHTAKKFGAEDARKQRVAIALSKARKAGVNV